MGDPMRPPIWVSKSRAKRTAASRAMGHKISAGSVPKLPGLLKYSRQVNRETLEGTDNPGRDAPFEQINTAVLATRAAGQPVISIDTRKKELIASTTTGTGLTVRCALDTRGDPKGIKVSDDEMQTLNITGDTFHPEWNDTISPRIHL